MSETKFTPGPWHRVKPIGSPYWTLGTIRNHHARPLPAENEDADWTMAEASPEMFEALELARKELLDFIELSGDCEHDVGACACSIKHALERTDTALAKARGEGK